MDIKSAKYIVGLSGVKIISVILNGQDNVNFYVPLDPDNTDYQEIMKQVEEGKLTIKDAE